MFWQALLAFRAMMSNVAMRRAMRRSDLQHLLNLNFICLGWAGMWKMSAYATQ